MQLPTNKEEVTMSDHRPVRACAIQSYAGEDVPRYLTTLWETDPHFQEIMIQAVEGSNASRRALEPDADELLSTVLWEDFPSIAAVDAANTALHQEKYLDELQRQVNGPNSPDPSNTVSQRLQNDRHFCEAVRAMPSLW
jgi:hypothetical protein